MERWCHTLYLFDRALEPFTCAQNPERQAIRHYDAHGNNSIIQCLGVHRVLLRKNEGNSNEGNPEHGSHGYRVREHAKMKRTPYELLAVDDAKGNGNSLNCTLSTTRMGTIRIKFTVRNVEPDCSYTCSCGERYIAAKTG